MSGSREEKKDLPPPPLTLRPSVSGTRADTISHEKLETALYQFITANSIDLPQASFVKIFDEHFTKQHGFLPLLSGQPIPKHLINFITDLTTATDGANVINVIKRMKDYLTTLPRMHPANPGVLNQLITFYDLASQRGLSDRESMFFATTAFGAISSARDIFFTDDSIDYTELRNALKMVRTTLEEINPRFKAVTPALEDDLQNSLHLKQQLLLKVHKWAEERLLLKKEQTQFANSVLSALTNHLSMDEQHHLSLNKDFDFASLKKTLMEVAENREHIDKEGKPYRMFTIKPFVNPESIATDLTEYLKKQLSETAKQEHKR